MPPKKQKSAISKEERLAYKRKLRPHLPPRPPKLREKESKKHSFKNPYPQHFSISRNIIYYISRNPINPQYHQNLIKTCKLLFRMSQIIPVDCVSSLNDGSMNISLYNRCEPISTKKQRKEIKDVHINVENQLLYKILIFCSLELDEDEQIGKPNFASALTKNIYKCFLKELSLQYQVLTFDELQILTSGGKLQSVYFIANIIKNGDRSITEFEKVFEALLCEDIEIDFPSKQHGIGKNTAKRMVEILEAKEDCCEIELLDIPEDFNFQSFTTFLKANENNSISLQFVDSISVAYKNQLEKFMEEFLESDNIERAVVPIIKFLGQNEETKKKIQMLSSW